MKRKGEVTLETSLSKRELEELIAKSEARLVRLKNMGVPESILIMEVKHLAILIESRVERERG